MAGLSHVDLKPFLPSATITRNRNRPSFIHQQITVAESPTSSYWASIQSEIQSYLKQAIPLRSPEVVFEPMRHLTLTVPTTTASSLCIAACELVGGDRSQAMAAAAALHLMYAAVYAHEHLELTDRTATRIGIDHKYGPNIELLTGDGMIPFGIELIARDSKQSKNEDRALEVIREITRCFGSQGIIQGQYHKLGQNSHGGDEMEYIINKTEGEIHACGGACGAILGGAGVNEVEGLRKLGWLVGMSRGMTSVKHPIPGSDKRIGELNALALKEIERNFAGSRSKAELISSLVFV